MDLSQFAFDAVIPSIILFNENIEPSAVKLYAIIKGLSRIEGYCYATNAYLAECLKCDESSIKRYLKSLEDEGFIERETNKTGFYHQRKIFISFDFKNSLRRLKIEPPPSSKLSPPQLKIEPHIKDIELRNTEINKKNKQKKEASPPSADASCLAQFLFDAIKEVNPEHKKPDLKKWAHEFDLMLRIDGRTVERAKQVINCAMKDPKWYRSRCKNPEFVRRNFDDIVMLMISIHEQNNIIKNRKYANDLLRSNYNYRNVITINSSGVTNSLNGKDVSFNQEHEEFLKNLEYILRV